MKLILTTIAVIIGFLNFSQTADEIIQKAEDRMKGTSSYAEMTITTIRPKWQREMKIKSWTKGDDYSATLVMSPAKDKGTVFLKRKSEIWNYIPSIERTIKMPPSMMSQSWMGTDMTNDDLVKESSMKRDYTKKIIGTEIIENLECYNIQLTPKENVNSIWGKVMIWISKKDFLQLQVKYYDEDNELINTVLGKNVKMMGGLMIPTVMEIIPADKKGHKTRMTYTALQLNLEIKDEVFTTPYMKRLK